MQANIIPEGDYSVIGIKRFNSCTEYWLEHLTNQTNQTLYIYKDYEKIMDHKTIVIGTKLNFKGRHGLTLFHCITPIYQPYGLPQKAVR